MSKTKDKSATGPQNAGTSLLNTFGQREQEIAAQRIVKRSREAGNWETLFRDEFFADDDLARFGFAELKRLGWMTLSTVGGLGWRVTPQFIERVTSDETKKHDK